MDADEVLVKLRKWMAAKHQEIGHVRAELKRLEAEVPAPIQLRLVSEALGRQSLILELITFCEEVLTSEELYGETPFLDKAKAEIGA